MCKWGTHSKVKLCELDFGGLTKKQHKLRAKKLGIEEDEEVVDSCIAPLVQKLNDYGIKTITSCCGHGKTPFSQIGISAQNIGFHSKEDKIIITLKFRYNEKPR